MQWFPRDKAKLDLFGLATRKEKNPWVEKFYVVVGILFFGYLFYSYFFEG